MLSFRHKKQTSKNVADTTFKGVETISDIQYLFQNMIILNIFPIYHFAASVQQGRRHRGEGEAGSHTHTLFCVAKRKEWKQREKRKGFKAETIKRLSPRLKLYCFSHSRASRIQKFFLSANHGG